MGGNINYLNTLHALILFYSASSMYIISTFYDDKTCCSYISLFYVVTATLSTYMLVRQKHRNC